MGNLQGDAVRTTDPVFLSVVEGPVDDHKRLKVGESDADDLGSPKPHDRFHAVFIVILSHDHSISHGGCELRRSCSQM